MVRFRWYVIYHRYDITVGARHGEPLLFQVAVSPPRLPPASYLFIFFCLPLQHPVYFHHGIENIFPPGEPAFTPVCCGAVCIHSSRTCASGLSGTSEMCALPAFTLFSRNRNDTGNCALRNPHPCNRTRMRLENRLDNSRFLPDTRSPCRFYIPLMTIRTRLTVNKLAVVEKYI